MKRKLFILFTLLCFLIPITGCDEENEDGGNVSLTVTLAKALANGGDDFTLNDCARVTSGPGNYSSESEPFITVEFHSKACVIAGVKKNGVATGDYDIDKGETTDVLGITVKNLKANENVNLTIEFMALNQELAASKVYFSGLTLKQTQNGIPSNPRILENTEYAFPYLNESNKVAVNKDIAYPKSAANITAETDLTTIFTDNGKALNLNYVYLKNNNGDFVFQPNKVTWVKGEWIPSSLSCSYNANATPISDINAFKDYVLGSNTCLHATIDTTSGVNDTLKAQAINNMLNSEIYLSTNQLHECLDANETANITASNGCLYAYKLKNLYNTNIDHTSGNGLEATSFYFGVNDNGYLEGISTTSSGNKQYLICTSNQSCTKLTIYSIDYEYDFNQTTKLNDAYKNLAIASFIDILGTTNSGTTTSYTIDASSLTFDYNHLIKDVAVTKVGNYYINYISAATAGYKYNPSDGEVSLTPKNTTAASIYSVKTNLGDTHEHKVILDEVLTTLSSDVLNLIFAQDADIKDIKASLRQRLYKIIETDEKYLPLRQYMFEFSFTGTNLTLNLVDAKISLNLDETKFIKFGEEDAIVCHSTDTDCIEKQHEKGLHETMINLASIDKIKGLSIQDIYIDEQGSRIYNIGGSVYTYTEGSDGVVKFEKDAELLQIVSGEKQEKTINKITYLVKTVIGDVTQILTITYGASETDNDTTAITTQLGGKDVETNPSTADIEKVFAIFCLSSNNQITMNGNFYKVDGKLVFIQPSGTTYLTHQIIEEVDENQNIVYKYLYQGNEVEYILDFA